MSCTIKLKKKKNVKNDFYKLLETSADGNQPCRWTDFLTTSQAGGCAPRGWSCREGTAGWRLTGQCWGRSDGATGKRWVAPPAEPEHRRPPAEAQTLGCIWCLPRWSSTVAQTESIFSQATLHLSLKVCQLFFVRDTWVTLNDGRDLRSKD